VLVGGLAAEDVRLGTGVGRSVVEGFGEDAGFELLGLGEDTGFVLLGLGGCGGLGGCDGLGGDVPPIVGVLT